ncbi:MAG: hypothetical protein JW953_03165 [Anaerolineae bacterium]|nr:hypothetical protein [Anaerolineae bacterium]
MAYGAIEARHTGNSGQLIVLIGENHASYKVQENVARIAEQLLAKYDIPLLLIEGYGEAVDTSFFDAIPDPTIRREVAWAFLETHEISGIEYAALVAGPDVKTIGVENMALWNQSKTAMDQETDLDDPAVQQGWEDLIDQVSALVEKLEYTDELDQKIADFIDEKIDFIEFYDYLLETAAKESVSTTALETAYEEFQKTLTPILRIADERDLPMVDNSLAAMKQENADVAILLMGHAHFQGASEEGGISALLQDKGVSYVYILPDGTEDETTEEENQYYEAQLNEIPSTFEAWLNSFFKPKPSLVRPNHQAAVEAVGKIVFLEKLVQSGLSWDQISMAHADLLSSGKIQFQNGFRISERFSVYPSRFKGEKQNETFVFTVSDSEPEVSHPRDLMACWQVGDQWISVIKGRSADILIRRGIVAKQSEPGKTFGYAYEINGGEGTAWQVGGQEITLPDISWDTFNALLDPERPVDGRAEKEEKIKAALSGGGDGQEPPFDGPPIIFPDEEPDIPDGEGGENYDQGSYFPPSDESGQGQPLDSQALAIRLSQWLPNEPVVYLDGNPELAKENLDQQTPARVENLGVVVDETSLNDEQREFARQIPEAVKDAGVTVSDEQISFSLDNFPTTPNVLFITAENDAQLEARLTELGGKNLLRDKYIVLLTCGDEGLRDFANWVVQEYGLTGLHLYRDKIHANTLPLIVGEAYRLAQAEPDLAPAELIDRAIEQAIEKAMEDELKQNLNRLKNNGWNQLSHQLDLLDDGLIPC